MDFLIALVMQFFAVFVSACMLDQGQLAQATDRLSVAYWLGFLIVFVRRSGSLTRIDHFFLRFGLLPILIVGVPITLAVWHHRGVS